MLKEQILFLSRCYFFLALSFCFVSYLSTWDFRKKGYKNSPFSEPAFPASCLVCTLLSPLAGPMVTAECCWQHTSLHPGPQPSEPGRACTRTPGAVWGGRPHIPHYPWAGRSTWLTQMRGICVVLSASKTQLPSAAGGAPSWVVWQSPVHLPLPTT